jgi:hypothetical protein
MPISRPIKDSSFIIVLSAQPGLLRRLLELPGVSYVLMGTLQSDRIESRFGIYRQIMGSIYNLTVLDVCNVYYLQLV